MKHTFSVTLTAFTGQEGGLGIVYASAAFCQMDGKISSSYLHRTEWRGRFILQNLLLFLSLIQSHRTTQMGPDGS